MARYELIAHCFSIFKIDNFHKLTEFLQLCLNLNFFSFDKL